MTGAFSFLDPLWEVEGIRAEFSARVSGVEPSYDKYEVLERLQPWHERMAGALGFQWQDVRRAEQVHGNEVAKVGKDGGSDFLPGVDGLLTNESGVCLGIYVADCAAIYLVDRKTGAIALLHSGRKGSEGNIVGAAIVLMQQEYGTQPADVIMSISPCVRPPEYEVDIVEMIIRDARVAGVHEIIDSGVNTARSLETYYSYRMEKGQTGRMLALLGKL